MCALLVLLCAGAAAGASRTSEFNPLSYMAQLPSLSLPYVNSLPIPSLRVPIRPTPVVTTKVVDVVTQYVARNPVCIKVSGKKPPCRKLNTTLAGDFLITKEYFVGGGRHHRQGRGPRLITKDRFSGFLIGNDDPFGKLTHVEGSEYAANLGKLVRTPPLDLSKIKELLIEDRLDYLEDLLPQYKRLKVYETKTITVTKQLSNNRATATLLVKNCIPQDISLCPSKIKRKGSTVING